MIPPSKSKHFHIERSTDEKIVGQHHDNDRGGARIFVRGKRSKSGGSGHSERDGAMEQTRRAANRSCSGGARGASRPFLPRKLQGSVSQIPGSLLHAFYAGIAYWR